MKLRGLFAWLLTLGLLLSACRSGPQGQISRALGVDVTEAVVVEFYDDHGGFHGDGSTYGFLLPPRDLSPELAEKGWQKLPLDDTARELMAHFDLTFPEEAPAGYFLLLDRQEDPETPILERWSYNFTLAIYSADSGTLYYYEEDT